MALQVAIVGASPVVVDLGPDLRVPQVSCGFDESHARGKRVVALPSAPAMAAWVAAGRRRSKGASSGVAVELGWMLERRVGVRVRGGEGMLVLVQGDLGSEEARIPASCAVDPVWFPAHAALRSLRALE